jgi:uncharacterized protein YktA (UPF0223 family)
MKTFKCTFGADIFAHPFELVIEKDILKLDDRRYYEAHYACCTFNTRRQNSRKGLTRIQLAPCCKINFSEDWASYWFYVKVDMSKIPGYTGPVYPLCSPIEPVTATCTALYNHWAVGFSENAFFLARTILGGHDVIEEFVAAGVWPISNGWAPTRIVPLSIDWATQEVPFPRFDLRLKEGQSVAKFIDEVEKKVDTMIGKSTLNEYKAYKNLVKHKKRVNRVFSKLGAETAFRLRRPSEDKKTPASCSAAPPKAPRRKSSKKRKSSTVDTSSPIVRLDKTKSLESSKQRCKASEGVSNAEIQSTSSLAQLGQKKVKTTVKKIVAAEVQRIPSGFFDDDMIDKPRPKGFSYCLWCDLRFNIRRSYSPGFENELVDIDSFSDDVTEAEKAATDSVVVSDAGGAAPQLSSPKGRASPEVTKDLDRTIQRREDPIENLFVVETREELPEGQDPSPSVAAFNESFGTSYRGELLSVSREMGDAGGGASKLLLLWNSFKFVDETGGEAPMKTLQFPNKTVRDLEKQPSSSLKKTSAISECVVQAPLETLSKKGLRTLLLTWLLF